MFVAVTGASGLVGGNLVRELLAQGHTVRALVREDQRALEGLTVERIRGDVLEPATLEPLCQGVEVVFHLAAKVTIDGDQGGMVDKVNIIGARHIAAAARAAGVRRLVHFSSIHALESRPDDQPIDERRPFVEELDAPTYDRTKAAGEREIGHALREGLDAVVINPTGIIGPYDHKPSNTGALILGLLRRELPALVDGGFDWVDVRDVAKAAIAAAERGRSGERYLVNGHWVSIAGLAAEVARASGIAAPRLVSPMWLARIGAPFLTAWAHLTGDQPLYTAESLRAVRQNSRVCGEKARAELGHEPRPFAETIADTVNWMRESGRLAAPDRS